MNAAATDTARLPRTLVVTGHFPPGRGGVQTFTAELVARLPADRVVVLAPDAPGAAAVDAALPYPVHRFRHRPATGPLTAARPLTRLVRAYDVQAAWVTSGMPLTAVAPLLRAAGVRRVVASTHGMEAGWATIGPAAAVMRRVTRSADVVTYLGEYTHDRLARAVHPGARLARLTGGVDVDRFHPGAGGDAVRARHRLGDRPVVVSAARLVARKGHDRLLRGWPTVLRAHPDAVLLLVGDGPRRAALQRLAAETGVAGSVLFTGSLPAEELPAHLDAGTVFALPCRDVWAGLQVEGLGLSVLEASATGLPVLVGRSGGAPDALLDGRTGLLVDGRDPTAVAAGLIALLDDPHRAKEMGAAGRAWVAGSWSWDVLAARLHRLLTDDPPPG